MRKVAGKVAVAALVAIGIAVAAPAMARGPKGGGGTTGSATCQVTPVPVPNGSNYTVSGSGYAPNTNLTIFVGGGSILMTTSSASGTMSAGSILAGATSGSYPVVVYAQADSRHRSPLANCTMQVQ